MSSSRYSAELQTDPALRRLVLLSGVGLGAIGLLLTLRLPVHPALAGTGALGWSAYTAWELCKAMSGYATTRVLRIAADGSLRRRDATGCWRPARLLEGSVVLARLAWIRFETEHGTTVAELFRGDPRKSHDWRRLQVIWRHIGAAE